MSSNGGGGGTRNSFLSVDSRGSLSTRTGSNKASTRRINPASSSLSSSIAPVWGGGPGRRRPSSADVTLRTRSTLNPSASSSSSLSTQSGSSSSSTISTGLKRPSSASASTSQRKSTSSSSHSQSAAHLIWSENRSVVRRSSESQVLTPESIDISKQSLNALPSIKEEVESIKVLVAQHNSITSLAAAATLSALTVVDLYANSLASLRGLKAPNLKVLLLGKNKLSTWSQDELKHSPQLDVLDIHDNELQEIPDTETMRKLFPKLRVLNVAGNSLKHLWGLSGCSNLREVNIRRNRIEHLEGLGSCSQLRSVLASANCIHRVEDMLSLYSLGGLQELALSMNGVARQVGYRDFIIATMPRSLKTLDGSPVQRPTSSAIAAAQSEAVAAALGDCSLVSRRHVKETPDWGIDTAQGLLMIHTPHGLRLALDYVSSVPLGSAIAKSVRRIELYSQPYESDWQLGLWESALELTVDAGAAWSELDQITTAASALPNIERVHLDDGLPLTTSTSVWKAWCAVSWPGLTTINGEPIAPLVRGEAARLKRANRFAKLRIGVKPELHAYVSATTQWAQESGKSRANSSAVCSELMSSVHQSTATGRSALDALAEAMPTVLSSLAEEILDLFP